MDKKKIAAYFDDLAPMWDSEMIINERIINFILDTAGVREGVRVLDVACGTGVLFPYYLERQVADVLAVDIAPKMTEIALRKASRPVKVVCADVEELTGTETFDCVVVYNAFPHFSDPAGLIMNLSRWLKPGGRLSVAHGMSLERLRAHHSGSAAEVSIDMLPAEELAKLMSPHFLVDFTLSDDEKYIVSGTRIAASGSGKND